MYPGNIVDTLKIMPVKIKPMSPSQPIILAIKLVILIFDKLIANNPPKENSQTLVNVWKYAHG